VSLGHPTKNSLATYESQQFGPAVPTAGGYFSQPAMYVYSNIVAWWQPYKDFFYNPHVHNGLDVAGPQGHPLYALETGVITEKGWRTNGGGYAIEVKIRAGTQYTFNHCSGFPPLTVGQRVAKGQVIAYIGATGTATGNHCHTSLDIDERGPDGVTRRLMWNPKFFMAGGPYANDPRIQPITTAPAPTPTTIPAMEAWQVPLRYRLATGSKTVKAGKPYRTKASVSTAPAGYFAADTTVRLIGRFPKTGSYDDWYLVDWYRGNGYGEAIVTSVDFK